MPQNPVKVYLVCTGVGIINRGIETFARECFDGLYGTEGLHIELFKGVGPDSAHEHYLWNLPRTGKLAQTLGTLIRRSGYVVEQLSSFLPFIAQVRAGKPDIIFYSDASLGFQLYRWRNQIGVPYRLLFSNGGPCDPPFSRMDYVQQVTPFYQEIALAAGEPPEKHIQVPYGIQVPPGEPLWESEARQQIRKQLGLPGDRPLILTVGWISAEHKRMDYVIQEVAALPEPRPYLVMLGHMDANSPPILDLAHQLLGQDNFTARSVPYQQVTHYYQCADVFVLGSLKEGFGRVYLEALIHGLPCIVNSHPIMQYVLGDQGIFADLSQAGTLTQTLANVLKQPTSMEKACQRRDYVRSRFSWQSLAPAYLKMFQACLKAPPHSFS